MTRLLSAIVLALTACTAPAQGPAGNTHPDEGVLTEDAARVAQTRSHPFGSIAPPTMDASGKRDLARAVDLTPLRDVAVSHNGRVKIMDTLARETVRSLTGKSRFRDYVRTEGEDVPEVVKHDPLFTLLDLWIDPGYYADKPLIGINFLPLREAYLELAIEDTATRERWKKLGLVTPQMVETYSTTIFNAHADEQPYREGVQRAENAVQLYLYGIANALMVAPDSTDLPWTHLASLPDDHPARLASRELGAAWRAGDAAGVNAKASELAAALEAIHPETYPGSRRSLELAYNRSNAFEWGSWAYFGSLLCLVLAFGTGRKWLAGAGLGLFTIAFVVHALGFAARCVIAERFAIQNQYESMTGVSLFAAAVGLVLMVAKRKWLFGAAVAASGFLVLITATQAGVPGEFVDREAAILNTSVLLKYHVTTVLTSYGLITLGFICSLFYLATHYGAKLFKPSGTEAVSTDAQAVSSAAVGGGFTDGTSGGGGGLKRTLKDLDTATMTVLQLAFWTLGVGILLGAWWADHSWGRWWAFDPKETWALVTWIVYLIVIHIRFTNLKDRGLTTAWLSVAGFFIMLWTYFGVNLLLPGLHAYA
ncbi:MAG: cytochrome c biogenesis protein CcsA [Phycisphaerales bacterium JB040]